MFGGPTKLAALLDRNRTSVWRWQVPRDYHREGLDGKVPQDVQPQIIALAKKKLGVDLGRDVFFPTYERVKIKPAPKNRAKVRRAA